MYPYFYALEKFNSAIHTLATGKESINERLLLVFHGELMMIKPDNLPDECRNDYEWVLKTITNFDEKYKGQNKDFESNDGRYDYLLPGRIEATLHRIRKSTGRKIAERIYEIWRILNVKYYEYDA